MEKIKVELEVSKEMHELMQGLVKIVAATKAALADGFQPGSDLPVVLVAAVAELPTMVAGVTSLPAEAKEDTTAFVAAITNGALDVVQALLKK